MNRELLSGRPSPATRALTTILNSELKKMPQVEGKTLYRGLSFIAPAQLQRFLREHRPGQTVKLKWDAFTSTVELQIEDAYYETLLRLTRTSA